MPYGVPSAAMPPAPPPRLKPLPASPLKGGLPQMPCGVPYNERTTSPCRSRRRSLAAKESGYFIPGPPAWRRKPHCAKEEGRKLPLPLANVYKCSYLLSSDGDKERACSVSSQCLFFISIRVRRAYAIILQNNQLA